MAESPTDQAFIAYVRQSNLCEAPVLESYFEKLGNLNALPQDSVGLARRLVVDGLLTKYQAEQLLMGRWKNFVIKGKYKVLERLSTGSMSNVFICEHILMKRVVALKMLPEEQSEDAASIARFHREARASAKLRHQNVVTVFDVDSAGKHHFLVAEYIDGSDLERVVKVSGPMPYLRAANYIRQAAEGLQHAHEMGMVHRDIKPGNLLLDRRGTVKLLDLGLARLFQDETDGLTKMADGHLMLGTLDYLAPEQAIDSHSVDIRADIYGLGATFYFLLAGEALFAGSSKAQKFVQHKNFSVGPIIRGVQGLPEKLALVVEKMLAKNPADRYQSPLEVAHALEQWTTLPVTIPSVQEMPKLSPKTRRLLEEMGSGGDSSNMSSVLISRSSMTPLPQRIQSTLVRAQMLKRTVVSHKYLVGGGVAALVALFMLVRSFTGSPASASAKQEVAGVVPPSQTPAGTPVQPVVVVKTLDEAFDLAKVGRTSEAAPGLRRLLMADPNSQDLQWMQLVILDLKNADYKAYRSDVAEMFKRFSDSTDPWVREKLAKVSLLAPEPIELTRALALAETAAVGAGEVKQGEWRLLTHGMALYRAGRYDEAISQLIATRDKASTENEEACECTSQLFLAMAHARLRHESQARAELDRGVHLLIADDVKATEGRWHDWIASQVIYREAETVLLSPGLPTGKGLVPAPLVTMSIDAAFSLAKAGRISEAVPALRQALMTEAKSEDMQWMQLAILDLKNGDNKGYHSDVEEMFRKFGPTNNNRWVAERLAKASLLGPEPVELARAMALADSAAAEGAKEKYGEWFMLTRGMGLYRSARYDEAIRQLVEAREKALSENNAPCECTCQLFLAMAHARLKHDTLARAEFERGVRLLPPENQTESAGSWFDWFGAQVVYREAEAVLKGPTTPIVKPSSSSTLTREQIDAMFGEGYGLAIANRTQEAAASYRKALKVAPESDYQWLRLAMLDAKNADAEAYLRDCTDILAQFGNTTDPSVAERVSKCLLIAPAKIDIKRVQRLAELAGNHGKSMEDGGWFLLVHGMWLYRAGQFEDAVQVLIAARDKTPEDAVRCRSLVHFFLAMAYGRLDRPGPANEEFKIGLDLLKAHGPKDDQNDLDSNWHDWFAAQAGRREAEALLKPLTK